MDMPNTYVALLKVELMLLKFWFTAVVLLHLWVIIVKKCLMCRTSPQVLYDGFADSECCQCDMSCSWSAVLRRCWLVDVSINTLVTLYMTCQWLVQIQVRFTGSNINNIQERIALQMISTSRVRSNWIATSTLAIAASVSLLLIPPSTPPHGPTPTFCLALWLVSARTPRPYQLPWRRGVVPQLT